MTHPCVLAIIGIPSWILTAFFLKKAVAITNDALRLNRAVWDEGSADRPPRLRRPIARPSLGHAMLVVFISWLFVTVTYFATGIVLVNLAQSAELPVWLALLVLLPTVFAVRAWVVGHLLFTTFGRGCLITLIHDLIQFAVLVVPLVLLVHLIE